MEELFSWQALIGIVVGVVIPILLAKYVPNTTWYNWGHAAGTTISSKGRGFAGIEAWEKLENNLTGSFVSFTKGLQDGVDADEAAKKE